MSLKTHHKLRVIGDFDPSVDFTTEEIEEYAKRFDQFDVNGDDVLDLMELKRTMEKLGSPQTHIQLKNMLKELGVGSDESIDFTEFLFIFKMARDGDLCSEGGLAAFAKLGSINVGKTGVSGAKNFFEAKAKVLTDPSYQTKMTAEKCEDEPKVK